MKKAFIASSLLSGQAFGQYSLDWSGNTVDPSNNGVTIDNSAATVGMTNTLFGDPLAADQGAMFQGNQVACSAVGEANQDSGGAGQPFSLQMWIYVAEVPTTGQRQTLYCDIALLGGVTAEERFCLYLNDGNLSVMLNDAPDDVTAGTQFEVDLGVDVVPGWNQVGVAINYDATTPGFEQTLATGYVMNEENPAVTAGASIPVLNEAGALAHPNLGQFFDSANYAACVGGTMEGAVAPYTSADPFSGIIRKATMTNAAIGGADLTADSSTACTGFCSLCDGTGNCFNQGSSIGTQNFVPADAYSGTVAATGTMSPITDTFHPDSYYVDGQGLFIGAGQSYSSDAATLTPTAVANQGAFSMMALAKPPAAPAGTSLSLTSGGAVGFQVDYASATSLDITVDGVTQTFAGIDNFADDFLAYGVSVFQTSPTDSMVCVSAPTNFEQCQEFAGATFDATAAYSVTYEGEQTMNDIEFFDVPFSLDEMTSRIGTGGCGTTNTATACLSCLVEDGECPTVCAKSEYFDAGACTACPGNCAACWGAVVDECYACTTAAIGNGVNYQEADTTCNQCGDSYRYTGEACDDGNTANGDGCDSTCNVENPYVCALGADMTPDTCTVGFASAYRIEYHSEASNPSDSDGANGGTQVQINDTPGTIAIANYGPLQPGPMGAILDGNMVGCSGTGQTDTFTGVGFSVSMWVWLPEVTTKQYLYCDMMVHADASISERFCLSVENGNLQATINDATVSTDNVGPNGVPAAIDITGATVTGGWNLISVFLDNTGTDVALTTQIFSEQTGSKVAVGPENIIAGSFVDSNEYITCVGASIERGATYTGKNGMSGIFRELNVFSGELTAADFDNFYSTTCDNSLCTLCEGSYQDGGANDNDCFVADDPSLIADYDFGAAKTAYTGSIADSQGFGPTFTDTYYHNKYFVDDQGLTFEAGETTTSAATFTPGSNSFTFQVTARPQAAGDIMVLGNQAAGDDLTLAFASTSSVSVDIGGQTATFNVANFADEWTTVAVTVQEFNGNTVVCASIQHALDYTNCQTLNGVTFTGTDAHDITLGGAEQTINNVKFYDSPISIGAMDAFYRTTCTTATAACAWCLDDGSGGATGTCIPDCAVNEFVNGGACTACHENCKGCFGDSANQCHACELNVPSTGVAIDQTFIDPATTCPSCGDSIRTPPLENCDDGNVIDGDGCSADCQVIEIYYICSDESATGGPDICIIDPTIDPDGIALEWNWAGSGTGVSDTGFNGDTVTFADNAGTNFDPIIPSHLGALYEGNNLSCTGAGALDAFVGVPFALQLYIQAFDPTSAGDQTLYCKQVEIGGNTEDRFCLYIEGGTGRLMASFSDAPDPATTGTMHSGFLGVTVEEGWQLIGATFSFDGTDMRGEAWITGDDGNAQGAGVQVIAAGVQYVDSELYYSCVGGKKTGAGGANGADPYSGYIRDVKLHFRGITDNSGDSTNVCNGCCDTCDTDSGDCFSTTNPPVYYKWDTARTPTEVNWVETISDTGDATGPDIVLDDTDLKLAASPFYLHGQGLHFETAAQAMQFPGLDIQSNSITMSMMARDTGAGGGSVFEVQNTGGAVQASMGFNAAGNIQVGVGTATATFTQGLTGGWAMAVASIYKTSPTTSKVCLSYGAALDYTSCQDVNGVFVGAANNQLQIGGGTGVTLRQIELWDAPLPIGDMDCLYNSACTANAISTCANCELDHTDCPYTCDIAEYFDGAACAACFSSCRACFEATPDKCYACAATSTVDVLAPALDYSFDDTATQEPHTCNSCGDGYRVDFALINAVLEECDDGNMDNVDGCNEECLLEPMWTCSDESGGLFDTTGGEDLAVPPIPDICQFSCSEGWIQHAGTVWGDYYKMCDDGNLISGDGCNEWCFIETGYEILVEGTLTGADRDTRAGTTDTMQEICGDGLDLGNWPCDDGNTVSGDGCDMDCNLEATYTCQFGQNLVPDLCREECHGPAGGPVLGAISDGGQWPCQDNNDGDDDGCYDCEVEKGWECAEGDYQTLDTCHEVCGDGYNMNNEWACDDGNVDYLDMGEDGCDNTNAQFDGGCTVSNNEAGYECEGNYDEYSPSKCKESCGDGLHYDDLGWWNYINGNDCDDGSRRPGDGCGALCREEKGWECQGGDRTYPDECEPKCGDWRIMYDEKCDDGNLTNNDGCDDTCFYETGMWCDGGDMYFRDACYEPCGDARDAGWLACDDGNQLDGDGCSATCELEQGWQCLGGDVWSPDLCEELCGDAILYDHLNTTKCDDGNLYTTDGCNEKCRVETGFTCDNVFGSRSTCYETCGDGIMLGYYECDDGNNENGDGCDANCRFEDCWTCDTTQTPSFCFISDNFRIYVSEVTFNDETYEIKIQFNTNIIVQDGFDIYNALFLEVEGPLAPYNMTWYLEDSDFIFDNQPIDNFVLQMNFLDSQLLGNGTETVSVHLNNTSQMKHATCERYVEYDTVNTFDLPGRETPVSDCGDLLLPKIGWYAFLAQMGVAVTTAMLGYSMGGAWDALYLLQFINLLPLLTIYIPSCSTHFFRLFDWANVENDYLAVWLRYGVCLDGLPNYLEAPTYNFEKMGYENKYFTYNFADAFTFIALVCMIIPLVAIMAMLFPSVGIFSNGDRFFKGRFLIGMINFLYLKMAICAHLNFAAFSTDALGAGFASFTTLFMISASFGIPMYYTGHAIIYHKELRSLRKKLHYAEVFSGKEQAENRQVIDEKIQRIKHDYRARQLFEEYNTSCWQQYAYMLWFCWSRLALAMIIAHMYNYPDWQMFLVITLISCVSASLIFQSIAWVAIYQPYKFFYRNAFAILNDTILLYILSELTCFVHHDIPLWEMKESATPMYYALGYLLIFNSIFFIGSMFMVCYNTRKKPMPIHEEYVPPKRQVIKRDPNLKAKVEAEIARKKKQDQEDKKKAEEEAAKKKAEEEAKADESKDSSSSGETGSSSSSSGSNSKKSGDKSENNALPLAAAAAAGVGAGAAAGSINTPANESSVYQSEDESLDSAELSEEGEEEYEEDESEEDDDDLDRDGDFGRTAMESDYARTYQ